MVEWGAKILDTSLMPGPVAVGMPAEDGRHTSRAVQSPLTGLKVRRPRLREGATAKQNVQHENLCAKLLKVFVIENFE